MSEKIPKEEFVRVHQSYIISLSKIVSIRGNTVSLNGIEIPIGLSYKKALLSTYSSKK
jgi:DNA-binding LytR/AlgR family response regulator